MGLLRTLGIAPAARVDELAERLRKAQARADSLTKKLEDVQAESRARLDEALKRLRDAEERLRQSDERAIRDAQRVEKLKADAEHQATREKKKAIDVPALEHRLDDAERDLLVARDHLMAIEVKLDILEGAANVLDARTRKLLTHADR